MLTIMYWPVVVPLEVSYNLYAGSVVGLGTDDQREALYHPGTSPREQNK